MQDEKLEAVLEITLDDEELAKTIIEAISPDDEPSGEKIKTSARREGKKVIVEMQTERGDIMTIKNTVEEYLRSIATVINALNASKRRSIEKTE